MATPDRLPELMMHGDLGQQKGWPKGLHSAALDDLGNLGLNLFTSEFMFPILAMDEAAVDHNIRTLARFCEDHGVSLAPHGKTPMSPELVHRQFKAGAWAITAATASQARIFRSFGVSRVLIAHQLIDPAGVRWAWDELQEHPEARISCLVDSLACVAAMDEALSDRAEGTPIDVLVELGSPGGRTGCRTIEEAIAVAHRVASSPRLRLVGTEGYEGIVHPTADDFSATDAFLEHLGTLTERLAAEGLFDHLDEVVVTAGGSMFPDRVVAVLHREWDLGRPVRVVIRPGCYVTHDSRMYLDGGPFGKRAPMDDYPTLQPALWLWSYVVSCPESGLALLGFGRRDVSPDAHFPLPLAVHRGNEIRILDGELEVFGLNDQHAYVRVPDGFELRVGDIVRCGISHPCTTLDRWRVIPLVDNDHNVVGVVRTFF
jgi:D-serine deaminase-like pyridoxal phosphate-dependent protein